MRVVFTRLYLIFTLVVLCVFTINAQNILGNPSFESGLGDWNVGTWGGPTATFESSTEYAQDGTKSAKTIITTTATEAGKVYFRQQGLNLSTSTEYQLVFYVLSSSGKEESIDLSLYSHTNMQGTDWGQAFADSDITFQGDGNWHKKEYIFTPSVVAGNPDFQMLALSFGFAKNATTIFLDNVSLMPNGGSEPSEPTNYFVSKSGDDANEGTQEKPFLTLSKAASVAKAGDVVTIHEGTYEETLVPVNSGTHDKPIIFQGADGEKVIITAMQTVNGWTHDEGSIYKTTIDWSLGQNNFIMNGDEACQLARWPNKTSKDPFVLNSLRNTGGTDGSVVKGARLDYSPGIQNIDWSDGGYIFFYCDKGGSGWTSWRGWITSNTSNSVVFNIPDNPSWIAAYHYPAGKGDFFLVGAKGALDYANEWYLDEDNKTLFLQTPDGETPIDGQIQVRKRKVCVDLKNKSYIQIKNLAVFGGSIEITGSASNNLLKGVSSFYGNFTEGVVNGFSANEQSVNIQGSDNRIEECEIAFGAASGIRDGGLRTSIINCSIHDFDFLGNYDCPVNLRGGSYTTLKNNTIYNGGRDCIQMFNKNSEIAYNNVYRSNLIADDCGLIYTVGGPHHTEIHHNWFHDTESRGSLYKATGIYLDNDASSFEVHHNVVWNTEWSNIQINWSGTDINIFNNTLWNGSATMGAWHKDGTAFSNVKVWNNLSDKSDWEPQADKQRNLTLSPERNPFNDLEAGDFTLRPYTQPINYGVVIDGITDGYVGHAPDAGAYEYGAESWSAGITWNPKEGSAGVGCYGLPGDFCSVNSDIDSDNDGVTDDIDECPNTPQGVEVDDKGCEKGLGLGEVNEIKLKLYPNPVTGEKLFIEASSFSEGNLNYSIINSLGNIVKRGALNGYHTVYSIAIAKLPPGTYLLMINENNKKAGIRFLKM